MTVGERIREQREKLNMSQVDLADKIDVSKQTLYKYENNIITNIPSDKIEAIANICHVSPSYLMGWSKDIVEYFEKTTAFDRQLYELGWDCEFIGNIATQECHYVFSNGKLSFNVSLEDYHKFVDDSRVFFKERIHTLLMKSTKQMFTDNFSTYYADAANAINNASTEDKKHDDDIMDDDNF